MSAFKDWLTSLPSKSTPIDADELYVRDSSGTPSSKKLTWANLKATAQAHFDALYAPKGAATGSGLTMATARLLGRSTASTGAIEEITVGSGLTLAGGSLTASGGSPGGSTTQVQFNDAGAFAGLANFTIDKATGNLLIPGKLAVSNASNPFSWTELRYSSNGWIVKSYAQDVVSISGQRGHLLIQPSFQYGWAADSTIDGSSADTGLNRNAAGVVEINNGTAGTYRDLKLRNLIGTGNLATGIVSKTANYTATTNDHTITIDASGGAVTITGFACSGNAGKRLTIKKTDSSGNAVTFDPNAAELVDGASTKATSTQNAGFTVQVNAGGTGWVVVATF